MDSLFQEMQEIGRRARQAARVLATLSGQQRQKALAAMPNKLLAVKEALLAANARDVAVALANGQSEPMRKRLVITEKIFQYMLDRLQEAADLPDPVGRVLEGHTRPNGLRVEKISVPIGVIGIIYEARPNVTTDAAAVCLKSGNAVILRGGSESLQSNMVLADAMSAALQEHGIPADALQIVRSTGHEAVDALLKMDQYIDVLIPRGGKSLIKAVAQGTRIPVIKHYEGICHLYLAPDAPIEMAVQVALNSKLQRVEVCNALETLLVDSACAERLLPELVKAFRDKKVELRGCQRTRSYAPELVAATEEDWTTEYLAPILSIRVVDGIEQAIEHINTYGSGHTDAIVTQNLVWSQRFVAGVDSGSVLVNASTRLSGGGDYGMGAVVGISTDKLHARGPVGANELTSYKWVAYGEGHLRE
jgi:glutamate-5-semialdehyde dehydrogenase